MVKKSAEFLLTSVNGISIVPSISVVLFCLIMHHQPHHLKQIEPARGSDFFSLFKSNPLKSSELTKLDIPLDRCDISLESGLPLGFYAAHDVFVLKQKFNTSESTKVEFLEKEQNMLD
jgi:hypothetical protein